MFLEFCEDDIKDAFTVFKDRFIVRKLLRELKAPSSGPSSRPVETVSQPLQSHTSSNHGNHSRPSHTSSSHNQTLSTSLKRSWSSRDIDNHHKSDSSVIDLTGDPSNHETSVKKRHPQPYYDAEPLNMQRFKETPSIFDGNKYQKTNSELMNQVVSSSNEAQPPSKQTHCDNTAVYPNKYNTTSYHKHKSETETAIDYSRYHGNYTENLSQSSKSHNRSSSNSPTGLYISEIKSEESLHTHHDDDQQPSVLDIRSSSMSLSEPSEMLADSDNRYDGEKHDFMMNLVTSTISQFTPDQLLEKKSVRGRPSEAQRLGTVLIRNAAQSAKIWNSAPLLKDIPYDQKETFMKYVLASAPQLGSHTELVWTRLREALQNRRKYLLDKECGKRVLKGRPACNSYYKLEQIYFNQVEELTEVVNIKQEMS